jgi:hypothetical protein
MIAIALLLIATHRRPKARFTYWTFGLSTRRKLFMVREWFDGSGERWLVRPIRGAPAVNPGDGNDGGRSEELMSFINFRSHHWAPNPEKLDPTQMTDDELQQMLELARLADERAEAASTSQDS